MLKYATQSSTRLAIGFAILAVTIVAAMGLSFGQDRSQRWVRHTLEVENHLANLTAGLEAAQAGQRAFVITGDESYLAPYLAATQGLPGELDRLGDVVKDMGFDDKVLLDAVVSGRLPFTMNPATGLRIVAGSLAAVQPGRLSIQREVLTDVNAGGGAAEAPPGVVEDLAFQAMENLSFDQLSADVNSLDGGRIAVLFHIRGRHAPPQRQELRLTLAELISRQFLNRSLPLPSGTQIDLTLDTTLNANQLISDLMAVNRARQGQQADQSAAPTPVPTATPTDGKNEP